ncbi:glycerate kinase [Ornithinimicrobium sp. Arc0846-15]|nr:glycerate kinase [Ornithinimicrobium laminariae]
MRVVVIADRCDSEIPAGRTAEAVRQGWLRQAGHDDVNAFGMSDGSLGFVDVMASIPGASSSPVVVSGPAGGQVPATVVSRSTDGVLTAYLDAAEAAGRHLVTGQELADPAALSSQGVGELLLAARELDAERIVIGVGALASHDGGAGLLRALGAGEHLENLPRVVQEWARAGLILAAATNEPLTGFHGVSAALGTEYGVAGDVTQGLEERMGRFTEVIERAYPAPMDLISGTRQKRERLAASGVGGGTGFALQMLGARTEAGAVFAGQETGAFAALPGALVVLVSARYDWRTVHDGVVAETATAALNHAAPSVVLSNEVLVGRREGMSLGISGTYETRPEEDLESLAARVARTWSPPRPN